MQHFDHAGQWQCVDRFAGLHQQGRQNRQRQRHADHEAAATAQFGLDLDLPAEFADTRLHHVHADAAAGDVGDFRLGREARHEDQMQALVGAQAGGGFGVDQALVAGDFAQALGVDAGAVVLDFDADVVAFLLRRQAHMAATRFAGGFAQGRRFDAVVDGVAHQVHQRVGQGFDQIAVQLRFGADQFQFHFLGQGARHIAGHLGEAGEHLADRLHAGAHDRGLQACGGDVQRADCAVQFFVAQAGAQGLQPVAREHQFADQVDDGVQALGVHAHGLFGFGAGLGRALAGRLGGGRMRIVAVCGSNRLGSGRLRRGLDRRRGALGVELRDQRGRRVRHGFARAHGVQHGLQIIQRLLCGIEVMRLQHRLARARHA